MNGRHKNWQLLSETPCVVWCVLCVVVVVVDVVVVVVSNAGQRKSTRVCSLIAAIKLARGALHDEELFVIEGSKTGAQLRDNPEEREKCGKKAKKKTLHRHQPPESCAVCTVGTRLCAELECLQTLAMD